MPAATSPFEQPGAWLRCALHAHTTNSDGELEPWGLVEHYARAGYDVLATTDHWHRTEVRGGGKIVVIPSAELNAVLPGGRDGHVLAYGIDALPEPRAPFSSLHEASEWITAHGGVTYLAHPYWSGADMQAVIDAPKVAGIEIFNAGCDLETGRGLSAVHWDAVLESGRGCFGIACDDSHLPGFDSDLAWTLVRARDRTPAAVLAALAAGAFYSTTGPQIHDARLDGNGIVVACDPCRALYLRSGPEDGGSVNTGRLAYSKRGRALERTPDGSVTVASFDRPRRSAWARVEVRDAAGQCAWTNPLPL